MSGFVLVYDSGPLAAPASSITATVDTTYRKFRVTLYSVQDVTDARYLLRLNADSGANYAYQDITADASTADSARAIGQTSISLTTDNDVDGGSAGLFTIEIEKPLASLPARVTAASAYMQATGPAINYEAIGGAWASVADLLSSITITTSVGNFAAGTRMVVEGAAP